MRGSRRKRGKDKCITHCEYHDSFVGRSEGPREDVAAQ